MVRQRSLVRARTPSPRRLLGRGFLQTDLQGNLEHAEAGPAPRASIDYCIRTGRNRSNRDLRVRARIRRGDVWYIRLPWHLGRCSEHCTHPKNYGRREEPTTAKSRKE